MNQFKHRDTRGVCESAAWGGSKKGDKGHRLVLAVLLGLLMLAPMAAAGGKKAGAPKVGPVLQQMLDTNDPATVVDVIVQYKVKPQQKHLDRVKNSGGKLKHRLDLIQGTAYTLSLAAVQDLLDDAEVKRVSLDHKVKMAARAGAAMVAINADLAQAAGYDGSGVGIAIADSGVYAHPDLNLFGTSNQRVVYSESFVPLYS